ncbi:alpha/beta hydrolase [Kribbella sp. NPDC051770]|uniref:alpha/beta hydrolase n=1 Tax=Kribbella sp. NPDC051770 TaxID=3155413 RepID=UPI0034455C45
MPKTDLPTLVLVNGAWHRTNMWNDLIERLPSDLDVRTVQLPSSAPVNPTQLGDLYDDAAAIRAAVQAVDGPVVVMPHSYGGAPATQGLVGLPNLRRIVYLCAFQLDVGESVLSSLGGERPPFWGPKYAEHGFYEILDAEHVFFPDVDPAKAAEVAATLGPQSVAAMNQPLTQAAWRTVPSTYIHAEKDVHPERFRQFSLRSDRVIPIQSAHSPFLSQPAELAAIVTTELKDAADTDR